jgi:peptidoglycan/LPS O-acetylase OafA/YrhL
MNKKIYFKNLNSLRFFAALIVLLSHIGPLKKVYGVTDIFGKEPFYIDAKFGLLLFFVLSGFLITYLLLEELNLKGTINVKAFYIRRALRIWPLYFLTIVLAFFIYPHIDFLVLKGYDMAVIWARAGIKILFFFILMPNLALIFGGNIPYATQSWSIGAEELFYFIWPLLFKKIINKKNIFIVVIIFYTAIYYLLYYSSHVHKYISYLKRIWYGYPLSCLAIGGVFAYLVFVKSERSEKIKKIFFNFWVQIIMLAALLFLIYSFLLGYQVCNFAANPKPVFSLENKLFSYLGKISYGIYMFHPVAIICAVKICLLLHITANWLLYFVILSLTIILAAVCYHFFELYFIKKKLKYSSVISGDNAKQMDDYTPVSVEN